MAKQAKRPSFGLGADRDVGKGQGRQVAKGTKGAGNSAPPEHHAHAAGLNHGHRVGKRVLGRESEQLADVEAVLGCRPPHGRAARSRRRAR